MKNVGGHNWNSCQDLRYSTRFKVFISTAEPRQLGISSTFLRDDNGPIRLAPLQGWTRTIAGSIYVNSIPDTLGVGNTTTIIIITTTISIHDLEAIAGNDRNNIINKKRVL